MDSRWFRIARILRTHGLGGELKIEPIAPHWKAMDMSEPLRVVDRHGHVTMAHVESMRDQNDVVLLKLREIDNVTTAAQFSGGGIEIEEVRLAELPDDEFYVKDLIGLAVVDEEGVMLGRLTQVLEMPANDIYEIEIAGEKKLIPAVAEFVRRIDLEKKQITVRVIPGLLDTNEDVAS